MTLPTTPIKAAAAAAAAIALTLTLGACGSKEETADGGLSTAASATIVPGGGTTQDNDGTDGDNADGAAEDDANKDAAGGEGDAAGGGSTGGNGTNPAAAGGGVQSIPNPFGDGPIEVRTYEPISDGRKGTDADRREMEEVVRQMTNPPSFPKWTRTILDNSCEAVRGPALEEMQRQGLTLEMVEQLATAQEQQDGPIEIAQSDVKVSDVRVDGDRASASVTINNTEGEKTQVQLFAKEDGKWKVCTA